MGLRSWDAASKAPLHLHQHHTQAPPEADDDAHRVQGTLSARSVQIASATFALPARSSRFPFPRNRNRTTRPTATGPGGRDATHLRLARAESRRASACFARRRCPGHGQRRVVRTQPRRPRGQRCARGMARRVEVRQTCETWRHPCAGRDS